LLEKQLSISSHLITEAVYYNPAAQRFQNTVKYQKGEAMPIQNSQDPIVQILQLAARRGFQILAEREQIAGTIPLSTNAPDEGRLRDGGANGNSRNVPAKDMQNADTSP